MILGHHCVMILLKLLKFAQTEEENELISSRRQGDVERRNSSSTLVRFRSSVLSVVTILSSPFLFNPANCSFIFSAVWIMDCSLLKTEKKKDNDHSGSFQFHEDGRVSSVLPGILSLSRVHFTLRHLFQGLHHRLQRGELGCDFGPQGCQSRPVLHLVVTQPGQIIPNLFQVLVCLDKVWLHERRKRDKRRRKKKGRKRKNFFFSF